MALLCIASIRAESESDILHVLRSEYTTYSLIMKQKGYCDTFEVMKALSGTMVTCLGHPITTIYPLLATLAGRLLVVPALTADCERGFSAASRIKTALHNRISTETLDNLMLIDIEGKDIGKFNFEPDVDAWAAVICLESD